MIPMYPTEGVRFGQGWTMAEVFRPVFKSDTVNNVASGCRNSEGGQYPHWLGCTWETHPAPCWFRAPFSSETQQCGYSVSGEPTPSPTGNLLSVCRLGYLVLAWQDSFTRSIYIFSWWQPVKLWFCTWPMLQVLSWAYRESFSWCGAVWKHNLVLWAAIFLNCFVGRCILSCHYIQKFTKKNAPAPLTTGCEAGSPEPSLPLRQQCVV